MLPSGLSPVRISEVIDGPLQTAVSRFSAVCAYWGGLTSSWTCMGRTDSRALLSPGLYLVSEENAFLFLHLWKGTACQAPPSSCWHHPPAWVWKSQAASSRGTEDEQDVLPFLPVNKQLCSVVLFYIQTGLKTLLDTHLPNCHFF